MKPLLYRIRLFVIGAVLLAFPSSANAMRYVGDPGNYRTYLQQLAPGDTLQLTAGRYLRMTIVGRHGTPSEWITITGPGTGAPAVIEGEPCCNTVQLYDCSFVVIKNLTVDALGYDVDGVNAKDSPSHHIVVDNCRFLNFGAHQATVAISTKSPAWDWVVRGNWIEGAGTGMYFGNSDGTAPFVRGIIEGNAILNPIGYCLEVKHQIPYSLLPGMPAGPNRTIIRNNVFIKDDRPSLSDRPNLLVGTFPDTGPGANDLYEIYGNFLFHNSRESLFQGTGRLSLHDNIFADVDASQAAIYLTDHNGALRVAHVYNNTILGAGNGIYFSTQPRTASSIVGNLVLTDRPIGVCNGCTIGTIQDNLVDSQLNASQYLTDPRLLLGYLDVYPRSDCVGCSSTPLDLSAYVGDTDYDRDFNGTAKGSATFRGAYAGSGANPGWRLGAGLKIGGPSSTPGGDTIPPDPPLNLETR